MELKSEAKLLKYRFVVVSVVVWVHLAEVQYLLLSPSDSVLLCLHRLPREISHFIAVLCGTFGVLELRLFLVLEIWLPAVGLSSWVNSLSITMWSQPQPRNKKKKKIEKKEGLKFLRLLHRPGHSHSLMALRRKTWRSDIQHKEVEVMYEGMWERSKTNGKESMKRFFTSPPCQSRTLLQWFSHQRIPFLLNFGGGLWPRVTSCFFVSSQDRNVL